MRQGKCINYKDCDSALADKIVEIHSKTQTNCKECGSSLEILEPKKPFDIKKTLIIVAGVFTVILLLWFTLGNSSNDIPVKSNPHEKSSATIEKISSIKPMEVDSTPKIPKQVISVKTTSPVVIPKKEVITQNSTPILKICGSNMINHEIMPKLVKEFLKEQDYSNVHGDDEFVETDYIYGTKNNQEYVVEIKADGTRNGYDDLLRQECDIAVSYGEMWQEIADKFQRQLGFNIKSADNKYEDAFAFDAIAIVVNKSNGIDALTSHQIRDIFHGDIRNWSNVQGSGKSGEIILYTMMEDSGIYHEFAHDLTKNGHDLKITTHKHFSSHEELEKEVAKHPNAIGFVSNEHVTKNVKLLALNESGHKIYPTASKIISEEYDLYDEIFLYTRPTSAPLSNQFRTFIDSVPTQEWISKNTKLVAADIITDDELKEEELERRSILNYGGLNSQYKKIMRKLVKTPVNFHFESGKNEIDHEVRIHLRQLEYLLNHHPEYNGKEIVLIGLSDSMGGDDDKNRKLSKERAESVHRILEEDKIIASHKIEVCAFGAHTPLLLEVDADNEHERKVDRRVEVWIDADGGFSSPLCH